MTAPLSKRPNLATATTAASLPAHPAAIFWRPHAAPWHSGILEHLKDWKIVKEISFALKCSFRYDFFSFHVLAIIISSNISRSSISSIISSSIIIIRMFTPVVS